MRSNFETVESLCKSLGGTKPIARLLITNNGLAAVKGIRSIREWAFEHIGHPDAILITVMATPDDLDANAEFVQMAHHYIEVPGGPSHDNYGNVELIVQTAKLHDCDAVYPGWGHASENPDLPKHLQASGIIFLGPNAGPMHALGDKIASTIVAQTLKIPTAPWSGQELIAPPSLVVNQTLRSKACISTNDDCINAVKRVGLPAMLKASEGGGGKGIRIVQREADAVRHLAAIREEVQGSSVFVMKVMKEVRHLEVQIVADKHSSVIALGTRDCSVQRRHQKIIEEAPAPLLSSETSSEIQAAAVKLASEVGYTGLGTVEFLYHSATSSFYFLELNPRLQVEHPVTEMIFGVNLPAILLCIGMGIPLYRIPELRVLYGCSTKDIYSDSFLSLNKPPKSLPRHSIAARITAEDAECGFRPTLGAVSEVSFRNSNACWGYFSVLAGGSIHEYADSQFGHIFATGATREEARLTLVLALNQLVIRGDILNNAAYTSKLLETQEVQDATMTTEWLDGLISMINDDACLSPTNVKIHLHLAAATAFRAHTIMVTSKAQHSMLLESGHIPEKSLLSNAITHIFVDGSTKYSVQSGWLSPNTLLLDLNSSTRVVKVREVRNCVLQLTLDNATHLALFQVQGDALRISIGRHSVTFTGESDPSVLSASVGGRLVRFLVNDGDHIDQGDVFCEIEVMKMILPLRSLVAGHIHYCAPVGTAIEQGRVLAKVQVDDPSVITRCKDFKDVWNIGTANHTGMISRCGSGILSNPGDNTFAAAADAFDELLYILQGFHPPFVPLRPRLEQAMFELHSFGSQPLETDQLARTSNLAKALQGFEYRVQVVYSSLLQRFLEVARYFACPERPDVLRTAKKDKKDVFAIDFALCSSAPPKLLLSLLCRISADRELLLSCRSELVKISELPSASGKVSNVLLQSRALLQVCDESSFDEEKEPLREKLVANNLHHPSMAITASLPLLCELLFSELDHQQLSSRALELITQRFYTGIPYDSVKIQSTVSHAQLMSKLHIPITTGCHQETVKGEERMALASMVKGEKILLVFKDLTEVRQNFSNCLNSLSTLPSAIIVLFDVSHVEDTESFLTFCTEIMEVFQKSSTDYPGSLQHITFVALCRSDSSLRLLTFVRRDNTEGCYLSEEPLLRNILPGVAFTIELHRLMNYQISPVSVPQRGVYIFHAVPRVPTARNRLDRRTFIRAFMQPSDVNLPPWSSAGNETHIDTAMSRILRAFDFAQSNEQVRTSHHNHLFVRISELEFDTTQIELLMRYLAARYINPLAEFGIREVELLFDTKAVPHIRHRITLTNPTLHHLEVTIAKESLDGIPLGETPQEPALMEQHRSSFNWVKENHEPYSLLNDKELRRLQAQSLGTTYVDDWLVLFRVAVRKGWKELCNVRNLDIRSTIPRVLLDCIPFYLSDGKLCETTDLERIDRNIGMRVWKVTYSPATWFNPDGEASKVERRQFLLVANDITVQSGSVSIHEDNVFVAASVYARSEGIPFIYVSSNSGARLGISEEVKSVLRVALSNRGNEVNYLFITTDDLNKLRESGIQLETVQRETNRHELRAIIGDVNKPIGVENLRGSAMTATEMARNYDTVPTLSIVSGRSVGIGAYLVRLGRRVVHQRGSSLILTGAAAINRLLGREVYRGNSQLGGTSVMLPNGISHWSANDDLDAARIVLRWLDFVPRVVSNPSHPHTAVSPLLQWPMEDPVDRIVEFKPLNGESYDPRELITGISSSCRGLFDVSSWHETQSEWAQSVIVGRASLGGIPVGVIAAETRATSNLREADPADPKSSAVEEMRAGLVWFPDSARKTADALADFEREQLPCIILANWRGFSGGMRDMRDEVLKFGASIVDSLRVFTGPVIIYIPPGGELRGGAWAVLDPCINHYGMATLMVDPTARANVLEPSGLAEIKFKTPVISAMMRQHANTTGINPDKLSKETFVDASVRFADLHDRVERMVAVGCVSAVVPWKETRRVFHSQLRRQLTEVQFAQRLLHTGASSDYSEALSQVRKLSEKFTDNNTAVDYLETTGRDFIKTQCQSKRLSETEEILRRVLRNPEWQKELESRGFIIKRNCN